VGRLLFQLEELGLRDETLVILTADHAGQTALTHHGVDGFDRGNFNWYYGRDADEDYRKPSPDVEDLLLATGGVKTEDPSKAGFYSYPGSTIDFVYGDSHLAAWMNTDTTSAKIEAAQAMRELPDVIATYYRDGSRYVRVGGVGPMSTAESRWFTKIKADNLVNTMAGPSGPEVVGLLRDNVSYGVEGDHGGHQKVVQQIQVVFSWPGFAPKVRGEQIRLVDILPTTMRLMGMRPTAPLDGKAYALP
jgi:arylsulfatase A-like enzyme